MLQLDIQCLIGCWLKRNAIRQSITTIILFVVTHISYFVCFYVSKCKQIYHIKQGMCKLQATNQCLILTTVH